MNVPTLENVVLDFLKVFKRFPLVVFASFSWVVLLITMINGDFTDLESLLPFVFSFVFGGMLALAVDLFAETWNVNKGEHFLGRILSVFVTIGYHVLFFSGAKDWGFQEGIVFFVINFVVLLLVFVAPALIKNGENIFWQNTIRMIIRAILAVIFFGIFYFGIALLMFSITVLFDVSVDEEMFLSVFVFIVGVFASMYFLRGISGDFRSLVKSDYYPRILEFLTQYILVPLVFLYMIVLYLYASMIVFSWEWPMGGVSAWIIGFLTVGIVTYFMVVKLKNKNKVFEFFERWLFVFFLPLLLVLFMAVGMRILDYGVTEVRYLGFVFGLWLVFLALYFVLSKKKDLRAIAISLIVIMLLSVYGPFSAFNVSRESQADRLDEIIQKNDLIVDGAISVNAGEKMTEGERTAFISITRYLVENHDPEVFYRWLSNEEMGELLGITSSWRKGDYVMEKFGIVYDAWGKGGMYDTGYVYRTYYNDDFCNTFGCASTLPVEVSGFDYYYEHSFYADGNVNFTVDGHSYDLSVGSDDLTLKRAGGEELINIELKKILNDLNDNYGVVTQIPGSDFTFEFGDEYFRGKLVFENLSASYMGEEFESFIVGDVRTFLRKK